MVTPQFMSFGEISKILYRVQLTRVAVCYLAKHE